MASVHPEKQNSVSVEIPPIKASVTTLDVSEDLPDEVCHRFFISYFARFLEQIGRIYWSIYKSPLWCWSRYNIHVIKLLRQIAFDKEGMGMEKITFNFDLIYHQTSLRAKYVSLFVSIVQFAVSIYIFYKCMFLIVKLKFVRSQNKIY